MEDVQAVGKTGRNTQQNYNFRGVDAVVNAVGPALRKHGVVVVPTGAAWADEHYTTKNGANMRSVTLTVTFRFYGPEGDWIEAQACGESADAGDKAIPKAHSVAYRTLLLQALCIPTDEPDPDATAIERGQAPQKAAEAAPNPSSRPAAPRGTRMRVKIQELANEADKLREAEAGTTWDEVTRVITWHEEQDGAESYGSDWESLSEAGLEYLGTQLKEYLAAGNTGISFYEHVSLPF